MFLTAWGGVSLSSWNKRGGVGVTVPASDANTGRRYLDVNSKYLTQGLVSLSSLPGTAAAFDPGVPHRRAEAPSRSDLRERHAISCV